MMRADLMLDGRYRLVEALGRGGMGEVWRARHERLDRDVAVKLLADADAADPKHARLFHGEARAAARRQHPGITVVHDFGTEQGLLFLVMELLAGESLDAVIHRHPKGAAVADVCGWGAQVAEALAAAHTAGVVHRDIKPGNLMLLPDGQVKVCDFGIARLQDATASVTAAGMGTAAYMAPEQITEGEIDGRTDLYALGCTLYHLLTGREPFGSANRWAVARKHLDEVPADLRALRPGTMLIAGGILIVGVWTFVVAAAFSAWGRTSDYATVIAVTSAPFFAVGAVLPLPFLHRNPRIGPARRTTGLAVAAGAVVMAYLLSLHLLRLAVDTGSIARAPLFEAGIPLAVLAMAGPGLALLEVWQSGSLGWPPERTPPLWLRTVFLSAGLLLAALAVVLLGLWPLMGAYFR